MYICLCVRGGGRVSLCKRKGGLCVCGKKMGFVYVYVHIRRHTLTNGDTVLRNFLTTSMQKSISCERSCICRVVDVKVI